MAEWTWPTGGDFSSGSAQKMPTFRPQGQPYSQGASGFYDPDSSYGADRDWASTPIISGPNGYLENNFGALYERFIAPWAQGQTPFARWVRGQSGEVQQALMAAVASNPLITAQGFLSNLGPQNFAQQWLNDFTPQQRGENDSIYGGGGARLSWL
jgi:hypothetical protein